MFAYYPDSFDPFRAMKYEQAMRQRQQALAEQRRLREAEMFLRQREQQREEAFRRNHAELYRRRQLQEQQRQQHQKGYQVVQDIDGQLYLVNVQPHSQPKLVPIRNMSSIDDNYFTATSDNDNDDDDESSTSSTYIDAVQSDTEKSNHKVISIPITTNESFSDNEKHRQQQQQRAPKNTTIVEDVSDTEEDEDASVVLDRTLRSRRPSPGQWLEPVEVFS